jgi:tetratricopeptide (TPR) repeat protein
MLAKSLEERFKDCQELLMHFQDLKVQLSKVKCPRCEKQNSLEEVFHCPRCGTQNLCLSHLVRGKHYCDHCQQLSQEGFKKKNLVCSLQWKQAIREVKNKGFIGTWFIQQEKQDSLILNIAKDSLELQMQSTEESFKISENEVENTFYRSIVRKKLLQSLSWPSPKFRFFPIQKKSYSSMILSPHPYKIKFHDDPEEFIKSFQAIAKIHNSLRIPGGLIAKTPQEIKDSDGHTKKIIQKSVGVLFLETGVAIFQNEPENFDSFQFVETESEAVKILHEVLHPECNRLSYRDSIGFPPVRADKIFRLSFSKVDQALNLPWEKISSFIPNLSPFLSHEDVSYYQEWDEVRSQMVFHQLSSSFQWKKWCNIFDLTELESTLLLVAVIKEELRHLAQSLMNIVQQETGNFEQLLLQILNIDQDNLDALKFSAKLACQYKEDEKAAEYWNKLGKISVHTGDLEEALHCYEQAISLSSSLTARDKAIQSKANEEANLGLLEIYYNKKNVEMVKKYGQELLPLLRKQGNLGEIALEKVCEILLNVDGGLIQCRKELINIHLNRGNTLKAISEYEALEKFYEQTGNKQEMAQVYHRILKLNPERSDIRKKLDFLTELELEESEDRLGLHYRQELINQYGKWFLLGFACFIFFAMLFVMSEIEMLHGVSLTKTQLKWKDVSGAEQTFSKIQGKISFFSREKKNLKKEIEALKKIEKSQEQNRNQRKIILGDLLKQK